MAYSPIEQGRLLRDRKLIDFAQRAGMTMERGKPRPSGRGRIVLPATLS